MTSASIFNFISMFFKNKVFNNSSFNKFPKLLMNKKLISPLNGSSHNIDLEAWHTPLLLFWFIGILCGHLQYFFLF